MACGDDGRRRGAATARPSAPLAALTLAALAGGGYAGLRPLPAAGPPDPAPPEVDDGRFLLTEDGSALGTKGRVEFATDLREEAPRHVEVVDRDVPLATRNELAPSAQPRADETCRHLGCAIGLPLQRVDLGLREEERVLRWRVFEGGVWLFVRDGVVQRIRLRPCPPLRGDLGGLAARGFTLAPDARVVALRDAAGVRGIEGHWLEGRGAECTITRVGGG